MRLHRAIVAISTVFFLFQHQEVFGKPSPRWTIYGLRPLGMGNAFVAVVDDYNAIFYNPAGVARLKSWDGELVNPALHASSGFHPLYKDITSSSELNSGVSGVIDIIEKYSGENFHIGLKWVPHLIFPNFGFGLGTEFDTTVSLQRDVSVNLQTGTNVILPVSIGKNFLDDRLSLGVTVKGRFKAGVDHEFSIDDFEALQSDGSDSQGKKLDDYATNGRGVGVDVGILFTPTKTMEPTLGLSISDLGGTSYTKLSGVPKEFGAAPATLPSFNVGFSLKPISANRFYLLTAVDMHSINQPFSFSKKFNLGAEIGYGSIIKLQAGLYQGYLTSGLQFDVGLINIRLVTYAEELGENAGFREDRRYALQIKII